MPRDDRDSPFYYLRLAGSREADTLYSAAFDLVRGVHSASLPASAPVIRAPLTDRPIRRGSHQEHAAQFPDRPR